MTGRITLRAATARDRSFLVEMLVEAVNWEPGRTLTADDVRSTRELAHYVDGWPGPADLGVVAEADGRPVGAAWLTHLSGADPGYGHVADDVPELSMAVVASWRGRGVGRRLLREIVTRAASAGRPAVSLSVERANRAIELYRSEGWVTIERGPNADTMLRPLHDQEHPADDGDRR